MNKTHKNDAVVFDVGGRCDAIDIVMRRLAKEPAGDEVVAYDEKGAFDVFSLCAQSAFDTNIIFDARRLLPICLQI